MPDYSAAKICLKGFLNFIAKTTVFALEPLFPAPLKFIVEFIYQAV
jgi:hypothetical protein